MGTFRCDTVVECAWLRFVREALILGRSHLVLCGAARAQLVAAIRAADVELCTAIALGVLEALRAAHMLALSERCAGAWHGAAYANLLQSGRAARVVPAAS
jgi:hypothetical protein